MAIAAALASPELAQLPRRRGDVATHRAQMHELFRRMVFNILIDNTDDAAVRARTGFRCAADGAVSGERFQRVALSATA